MHLLEHAVLKMYRQRGLIKTRPCIVISAATFRYLFDGFSEENLVIYVPLFLYENGAFLAEALITLVP